MLLRFLHHDEGSERLEARNSDPSHRKKGPCNCTAAREEEGGGSRRMIDRGKGARRRTSGGEARSRRRREQQQQQRGPSRPHSPLALVPFCSPARRARRSPASPLGDAVAPTGVTRPAMLPRLCALSCVARGSTQGRQASGMSVMSPNMVMSPKPRMASPRGAARWLEKD